MVLQVLHLTFLFRRSAGDSRPPHTFPATSSLRVPSRNSKRWQAVKSEDTGKPSPLIVRIASLSSGRVGRRRRPIHSLMAEWPRKRVSANRSTPGGKTRRFGALWRGKCDIAPHTAAIPVGCPLLQLVLTSVRTIRLTTSGSPSQAEITHCKSASSEAKSRQLEPSVCSAFAARQPWQKSQGQSQSSVTTILSAASNPVAPTFLRKKPFGENVEGLSHCGD